MISINSKVTWGQSGIDQPNYVLSELSDCRWQTAWSGVKTLRKYDERNEFYVNSFLLWVGFHILTWEQPWWMNAGCWYHYNETLTLGLASPCCWQREQCRASNPDWSPFSGSVAQQEHKFRRFFYYRYNDLTRMLNLFRLKVSNKCALGPKRKRNHDATVNKTNAKFSLFGQ